MRAIIVGGGTGGHIVPAVAIADYIMQKQPDSKILFIGADVGMEKDLVPKAGYDIKFIQIIGFKRRINFEFFTHNVRALYKINGAIMHSRKIISSFRPDVVIGTGGYVSGPVLYAAAKLKIPTLIHESNAFPGVASKILARYVDCVCINFKAAEKYFHKKARLIQTGNILRDRTFNMDRVRVRESLGVPRNVKLILASGGSLGARGFNDAVLAYIKATRSAANYHMLFGTGEADYEYVIERFNDIYPINPDNITILPYIHNMPEVQVASDLIIARGGAMTLSEIAALNKPCVLIPSPNVTMNHQEYNAKALADAGAAVMFTERELQGGYDAFVSAVSGIINNPNRMRDMAQCCGNIGITNGTQTIYELILRLVKKKV